MAIFKLRNLKSGQATPIPQGEFTLGRAEDASVQVDDSSVSRHHARLVNDEQGLFVEDLGSANGVAVRGAYVTGRTQIKLGDLIHVGKVPFRIDPEMPADVSAAPAGELLKVDHAFMRKETERIPASEPEAPPVPAAISFTPSMAEPAPKGEPSKSGPLIRHSVPLPTLARLTATPPAPEESAAAPAAVAPSPAKVGRGSIQLESGGGPEPSSEAVRTLSPDEVPSMPWWWWAVVFLAGLGSGLLLGLFFARIFFQMGGHPASLP